MATLITPAFRRLDDWNPIVPASPPDLPRRGAGHWINCAFAFNNPTIPVGLDGAHTRLGRAKPWEHPRAVLRHRSCGGVVGTVLCLGLLTVLGVLDHDRLYRRFEVLSLTARPFDPEGLAAATEVIKHGHCHRCGNHIPISPSRRDLRSLPTKPTRKPRTIPV